MFESSPDTTAVTSPAYGAADGGQPGPSLAEREEKNISFTDLEEFNACWQDYARLTDKQLIVDRDRSGARCRVIYCSKAGCKFKLKVRGSLPLLTRGSHSELTIAHASIL